MKLPEDIYEISGKPPHYAGFDIHHKPDVDDQPCQVEADGKCHRTEHLFPVAPAVRGD